MNKRTARAQHSSKQERTTKKGKLSSGGFNELLDSFAER